MRRLISETDDDFERVLLGSVRADVAPENGARDALLALSAAATNLPAAASAGAGGAALGAEGAAGAKLGSLAAVKWLCAGAVVGGVTGAGLMAGYRQGPRAPEPSRAAPTVVTERAAAPPSAASVPAPPVAAPPAAAPPRVRAPVTSEPSAAGAPEAPSRASATAAENASTLAVEAAAIDGARRALGQGSPGLAIALLDRYERESPTHALAPDAQALRIHAEKARGNGALAKQLAEKFLAAHPNDPHAERVRRVLSGSARP